MKVAFAFALLAVVLLVSGCVQDNSASTGDTNGMSDLTPGIGAGSSGQTHDVDILNFVFIPKDFKISVGDTVKWTNSDSATHTIVSDDISDLGPAELEKGDTYSYKFTEAGEFVVYCEEHPYIKGTITVE